MYKKSEIHRRKISLSDSIKFPDIIVVELYDDESNMKKVTPQEFTLRAGKSANMSAKYKLDSAIIRNVNQVHFACVLTINGVDYGFDGESLKKLNKFNWRKLLTTRKNWTFKGSQTRWNFRNGYQQLFYYRTQ